MSESVRTLIAAAVVALLVIGGVWFFLRGAPADPAAASSPSSTAAEADPARPIRPPIRRTTIPPGLKSSGAMKPIKGDLTPDPPSDDGAR